MTRILALAVGFCVVGAAIAPGQEPARSPTSQIAANPATTPAREPRVLFGTPDGRFTTIQGNALDAVGAGLPQTVVRLRDGRTGHTGESMLTDDSGMFAFKGVDPGSYVVEVLGTDSEVLAASPMVSVNPGESISAIVQLPFRIPPSAGVLGHSTRSAVVVASAAASARVLAATITQASSPE